MESHPNTKNTDSNYEVKDGKIMSEKARKMVIESLKATLQKRENNPNPNIPEDYYDKVEETLREQGEL